MHPPSRDQPTPNRPMHDMVEVWRPVVNYEDRYEVSSLGRVRSLHPQRFHQILVQKKSKTGYWMVGFWVKNKQSHAKVAKLVAMAFLGPPKEGEIVLHGLNGKEDNSVSNLSWGTYRQNALDKIRDNTLYSGAKHWKTKLNEQIARTVFDMYLQGYTKRQIAEELSVTHQNIRAILIGKTWKHVYAEKMEVPLMEVYDMWALGEKNASQASLKHLRKVLNRCQQSPA